MARPKKYEQLADKLATAMIEEIEQAKVELGKDSADALAGAFLARFLGVLVYSSLTGAVDSSINKKDQYSNAAASYGSMKALVQEAVALAFSEALGSFAKKDIDYMCQITPVEDSKGVYEQ